LNQLSTLGALLFFASFLIFLWNVATSWRNGAPAPANPWNASTLEWAPPSPPPPQNFDRIPFVDSRTPLWREDPLPVTAGLSVTERELAITSLTEAMPQLREQSPDSSLWPLIAAVAVTIAFVGSIFTPWAVVWGGALVAAALVGWFWPKSMAEDE
jgi:cytochrome c oxidase subunit 1